MSATRDIGSGVTTGLVQVLVLAAAAYAGWRIFAPQLVALAGAAGAAAGEQASNEITSGVSGAAPGIGAQIGQGAVEGAKGEISGSLPSLPPTEHGSVDFGGTPVEIT